MRALLPRVGYRGAMLVRPLFSAPRPRTNNETADICGYQWIRLGRRVVPYGAAYSSSREEGDGRRQELAPRRNLERWSILLTHVVYICAYTRPIDAG